jgi:hypothetical protein
MTLKRAIPILLTVVFSLFLSGCFLVELILPPIGGGTSRLALYLNYNGIQYNAHRLSGVECMMKKVELISDGKPVQGVSPNKTFSINLRPENRIDSFSSLLNLLLERNIAQYEFERDTETDEAFTNPQIRMTFEKTATATYILENEDEETTYATTIAMELPDTDLVLSVPIKVVTNNQYRNKGKLSLPIGQSTLYVLLNFQNIPPYATIDLETLPVQLEEGFVNSISLLQDESTLVYGTIEDRSEEDDPAISPGETWSLNFYDYYFEDKDFVISSYPITSGSNSQLYYFLVPKNNYNSTIYLRPPGLEDEDAYSQDVTIGDLERVKEVPTIIYPPE